MTSSATISWCKKYRYTLHRDIPENAHLPLKPLLVIGLNPSTAAEIIEDNTSRKITGFGRLWGCTSFSMGNLFGYRTAYPTELWAAQAAGTDIIGPDNDRHLKDLIESHKGGIILAAWGAAKKATKRAWEVSKMLPLFGTQCLDINKDGSPEHPLYVGYNEPLKPWIPPV